MLEAAIGCFALAALGGVVLLTYVMRGIPTPKGLALGHGALAATGLVLLGVAVVTGRAVPPLSLGLFVAAALGGFFLLYRDLKHGHVPKPVALMHGALAVTAFVILVAAAL